MLRNEIDNIWIQLKEKGGISVGDFSVFQIEQVEPNGKIMLALDGRTGSRHMLIPITSNQRSAIDQKSSGVHVLRRILDDNGKQVHFVDVCCVKPHLEDLFSVLIEDILLALKADPGSPDLISVEVIHRWRELFERDSFPILSVEAQAGLFGELFFLKELLERNPIGLKFWAGASNGIYDFVCGVNAIEVKTRITRTGRFFWINGHRQLEIPSGGQLFLVVMTLALSSDAGESLNSLVKNILELPIDKLLFRRQLAFRGYLEVHSELYETSKFRIDENRIYQVNESFPRIVTSSFVANQVPPGIIAIKYQIDLSNEPPFPLTKEAASQIFSMLARER